MKKLLLLIFTFSIVTHTQKADAAGLLAETPVSITTDMAINSDYVWRGFLLDEDVVMQPGIYISGGGFTFSLWSSFDMQSDDALDSDEVDYSIDYTKDFKGYSLSVGLTYYDFPEADTYSREFYVGVVFDTFLSPSITWYHDFGNESSGGGHGDYLHFAIAHSIPFGQNGITLDLNAGIGFNQHLFIEGTGGDFALGAGLNIPLNKNVTITPNFTYSLPFGDMKDSDDGNQDNELYTGVTIAYHY